VGKIDGIFINREKPLLTVRLGVLFTKTRYINSLLKFIVITVTLLCVAEARLADMQRTVHNIYSHGRIDDIFAQHSQRAEAAVILATRATESLDRRKTYSGTGLQGKIPRHDLTQYKWLSISKQILARVLLLFLSFCLCLYSCCSRNHCFMLSTLSRVDFCYSTVSCI